MSGEEEVNRAGRLVSLRLVIFGFHGGGKGEGRRFTISRRVTRR